MSNESRNEWIFGCIQDVFTDKTSLIRQNVIKLLNFTTKMFKYNNLPDTITTKDLEIILQVGGFAIFKKVNDKLYAFRGGLGGKPNPYYLPTIAIVANPALNFNKSMEIDSECVVMLNDHFYQGMMPTLNKYATLLAEAEMSLRWGVINYRVPSIAQADNDSAIESAKEFFKKVVEGKEFGLVTTKALVDGLTTHEFANKQRLTEIIEAVQYIKGSLYNEICLNASFNMKREAINEAEASMNDDILYPLLDVMLECRKQGLKKVNDMFGENITVELDSVWADNREKEEISIDRQEVEKDIREAELENIGGDNDETDRDTE